MHHDLPTFFEALRRDEAGQSVVEYAFALSFIMLVCVTGLTALGVTVRGLLTGAADSFPQP